MLVESLGTSLLVGKVRGGKFSNISSGEIRGWYFIISSFIVEFSAVYLASKGVKIVTDGISFIHLLSYILLFIGLFMNFDKYPFWIITAGVFLNFLVIMANGGQMPISIEALESLGLLDNAAAIANGRIITHTPLVDSTKLKFLSDILAMPKFYPRPKVYSIGDVLMAIGVFIYMQHLMLGKDGKFKKRQMDSRA
ncbi:MAG: DUF5317 domain-containing protein [Clostridiales bacterium]|nr:DUF5317 domain-containing protein [Clostridiales bacterium]